jgi:tight adherence protein C
LTVDRTTLVWLLAGAFLLAVSIAGFLMLREADQQDLEERLKAALEAPKENEAPKSPGPLNWLLLFLRRVGDAVRTSTCAYTESEVVSLERSIAAAGLDGKKIVPILIGFKVVLLFLVPALVYVFCLAKQMAPVRSLLYVAGSVPVGMLGPDYVIRFLRRPFEKALRRGIPDALDLMVICAEAGLGFESSVEQVATEMRHSNPAVAIEFSAFVHELKVLPDRRQALVNLGQRSGMADLQRLATILSQTLQYGTSLSQALRSVAADLRRERLTRIEAKAARLPPLLVIPMILFIMPCLFIILGGSAALRVMDSLKHMG